MDKSTVTSHERTESRSSNARGLLFVAVAAAVLAVVNALLGPHFWLDVLLFAGMAFAYMQYGRV